MPSALQCALHAQSSKPIALAVFMTSGAVAQESVVPELVPGNAAPENVESIHVRLEATLPGLREYYDEVQVVDLFSQQIWPVSKSMAVSRVTCHALQLCACAAVGLACV